MHTKSYFKANALTLAAFLITSASVPAQPGPFPFGGFGGNTASRSSSSSSARQYPNNGVGGATFAVDPESGSIIVNADPQTLEHISQVLSNLDRPRPQVLIKVVFLEVTRNDSLDFGIEASYGQDLGNNGINAGYITNIGAVGLANVSTTGGTVVSNFSGYSTFVTNLTPLIRGFQGANSFGLANAGGPAGLYQIFSQDYTVTLRAIANAGKAKVLSRPSIVARNNQPATISVGQSVPLINGTRVDNFGNAINSFSYQSVGIILRVTPYIKPDGLVEMILAPETSELVADRSQWIQIQSGPNGSVSAPLINSRSADTVVVTPNAQTVIIGGLLEAAKAESEAKIPLLGDIPLLGNFFKHKIKSDARTELMIFLTPYIMGAPMEMASLSEKERAKSDAMKALTEPELNKFLEDLPLKERTRKKKKSE